MGYAGADWLESQFKREVAAGKRKPLSPFARLAADLIGDWQRGIYHLSTGSLVRGEWGERYVSFCVAGALSTYDGDKLTRLVMLAHERCVRATVEGASNHYLRITLHPRQRDTDSISTRHPTIESAIEAHRKEFGDEPATTEAR